MIVPTLKGGIKLLIHVVKRGDNLHNISRRYDVPLERIVQDNQLENPALIMIGQALVIRGKTKRYIIKQGETLYQIASRHGINLRKLLKMNPQITDPEMIFPGMAIEVPATRQELETIKVNGFVFPGSSMKVVSKTLPNLTYLSIFSYSVNSDGSLNPINDVPMIKIARANKVAPLMVITNTKEKGEFDSNLAHDVLIDPKVQSNLINSIINILETKKYYGININFEYVYPEDKEKYNRFLRRISERLHSLGYIVTTSLAPKYSQTQKGLLYEAHDYKVHGEEADWVVLMTYEWGFMYGPPMAVSPLTEVQQVLNYTVTEILPQKISMGIPNYGYDWSLPYEEGKTKAKLISNTAAIRIATEYGVEIKYDKMAQTPFFTYYDENKVEHIVWFEDARSIAAKLKLLDYFDIGGVSYWTIDTYFSQNWLVLSNQYNIKKVL